MGGRSFITNPNTQQKKRNPHEDLTCVVLEPTPPERLKLQGDERSKEAERGREKEMDGEGEREEEREKKTETEEKRQGPLDRKSLATIDLTDLNLILAALLYVFCVSRLLLYFTTCCC